MQAPPAISARRRSSGVLMIPLLAVSFGIVSVLLSGGVAPAPPPPGSSGGELLNTVSLADLGILTVFALGLGLAIWTYQRLRGGVQTMTAHFLIVPLAVTCSVLVFLVLVHLFVHGGGVVGAPPLGPGNRTGSAANDSNPPTLTNNSTGPLQGPYVPLPSGWPWWVPYLALLAVAIGIGILSLSFALARSDRTPSRSVTPPPAPPDRAIRAALSTLEQADDPRRAIITMYGQLLEAVGGRAGPVEPQTARELARELVAGLGVSEAVAQELTDRFEEARYSTQPLRQDALPRTRLALTQAVRELARAPRGS